MNIAPLWACISDAHTSPLPRNASVDFERNATPASAVALGDVHALRKECIGVVLITAVVVCSVVDDGVAVAAVGRTSRRDVSVDTGAARATSPRASDDPIAATSTATNIALIAPRY
jgi:hypothetical protein